MRLGLGLGLQRPGAAGESAPAAPVITSSNSVSVAENATLSKSLTADQEVTWSIVGGADQAEFEISGSTLRWASNGTQDYESPADADTDNAYVVTVRATNETTGLTADQTITATVTDVADDPPVPDYANPGGSGNRAGVVSASTTITMLGSGGIAVLLDGATSDSAWFTNGQSGRTITFDFGSGASKVISEIRWRQASSATHGQWVLEGSQDDISYQPLSNSFTLGGATDSAYAQDWDASAGYRYYRLRQVSGSTSSNPFVREIDFKIDDATSAAVVGTSTIPSYLNSGGRGDRTASIAVTTTATVAGGTINNAVDGAFANDNTDAFFFDNGESGRSVTFDFGTDKIITAVAWQHVVPNAQGTWKVQGSADNSSYADLSSAVTLAGVTLTVINFANATAYRYYRLLQTSGTTSATQRCLEVEFKIAA